MATINQYGNKQTPVLTDKLHLWSTADGADMNITLEQARDLLAGILANLDTDDKASIVAAINELNGPVKNMASRPINGSYSGRNLKTYFGTAANLEDAIESGDFSHIATGDYWPLVIAGTFKDYAANANKTINETFIMEIAGINHYWRYGESGAGVNHNHLAMISRDTIPFNLQYRSEASTWYDETTQNPWTGSHLFQTLNNATDGLVALILASELGQFIYTGPNGKGMRSLMETKAKGATAASSWAWKDRGILFIPTEKEYWGNETWAEHGYGGANALQFELFAGSRKHLSKGLGNGGSRATYWSESSNSGGADNACLVGRSGHPSTNSTADTGISAPLCFLLGKQP